MYNSDGTQMIYEVPWEEVNKEPNYLYIQLDCTLAAAHSTQLYSEGVITLQWARLRWRDRRLSPLSRPACFARCGTGAGGGVTGIPGPCVRPLVE